MSEQQIFSVFDKCFNEIYQGCFSFPPRIGELIFVNSKLYKVVNIIHYPDFNENGFHKNDVKIIVSDK